MLKKYDYSVSIVYISHSGFVKIITITKMRHC